MLVILDSVVETEADVSEGFAVEVPPGVDIVLVGDLYLFSIGSWRCLNGFWWRVGDDLPLSLAHEEALHHGCQEIGLVALMFFFELLFSYVLLTISFYVSFTNLFSIILFLIC